MRITGAGNSAIALSPLHFFCRQKKWSGKRDSNSRQLPWQGRALPTELFPLYLSVRRICSIRRKVSSVINRILPKKQSPSPCILDEILLFIPWCRALSLLLLKGLIIKSEAVERLFDRVAVFSSQGKWEKAENIINMLIVAKPWDKRLLLAKANLKKKMWIASGQKDHELLEESLQLFSRCHLLTGSIKAGINSATLLLLSGRKKEAYKRADDTARHCRLLIMENKTHELGYYAATIAEVNLLRGKLEAAELWYKTALSKNSRVSEEVLDNMNLLLDHLVPEPDMVVRIREAVGA